jgi:alpha-glucoside transport system permease protein
MGYYLAAPMVRTLFLSFFDRASTKFVGLDNFIYIFTDSTMLTAFWNNFLWMVFGTSLVVVIGLTVALLAERSYFEKVSKAIIFLPMAISFVGAGVIWKFVYAYKPPDQEQIGLINAIVTFFGNDPVGWYTTRPWNTFFLIIIFVWLYTGFATVILSAALKGVPTSIIEAARIDGANEVRIIFSVIIPYIKSTIITVTTSCLLFSLKIFDVVYTMTNGLYGTEVLASQQYKQMFKFLHYGRGSAIALIILIGVIPVMWYNLKQFHKE